MFTGLEAGLGVICCKPTGTAMAFDTMQLFAGTVCSCLSSVHIINLHQADKQAGKAELRSAWEDMNIVV